ncbi:MAG: serine/threonine-protein kinase PknK, partial [Leptospiraceae bacterium]|nr:serine/threonine-protein kinase PknK [Leptospiraceae bacterium]
MDFAGNRCTLNAMLESLSLPGYEIGEVMHDGMTRAVRQSDLKSVLLKTVPEKSRPETPARLRREFEIARSLPLEIAPYLDLLEGNRWPILVLEDRSFVTLDDWNWASLKDFLIVASRLAIALDTVHESGLVHRDIHPGSILVDAENRNIAIIDYGISSLYSGRSGSVSPGSQIEGTLLYMAPEQTGRTNRHIDHRSDIYSLGATLYKALGGDPPYDLNDALQLINAHLTRTPERLKKDRNGGFVPDILNEILLRLMARDQEDRYQTAMGLAMDLRKCLDRLEGNNQIPLFSVGEGDFPRGLTIPQKLYGRQRELKQLRDCLEDSARTPLVLVTGQSGSGKSSLVQEFRRTVSEKQGYFLSGKFEPDKKDIPYYGIARCIAELVEILLARDSGQAKEKILPRLRGNGQVLVNTVPSLEKLLGPQPEPAELAPEEERTRFRLTLLAFLGSFADSPLVFFLDDLQWADLASLDLIQDLLEYREYSLNILGTYREEEVNELHPLSRAKESYQLAGISSQVIHLKPLGPRDLKLMLLDTFRIGAEDDDAAGVADLADLLYKKSEGNPFVARQYLESLYEKQLIRQDRDSGSWRFDLARIRTDGLSSSAAELLAARIASLPDCQEVLTAAACLGNRFSLASLAALAGQDILFTLKQLQTIAGADIIYPLSENYKYISTESSRRDMEDVEFAFSHDRIHEAVLAQILPSRLEQLNLDAARLILDRSDYQQIQERIGSIVSHYNQGRNLVWEDDEKLKIAELNLKAGLKERRSSAIDEAIIHFGIALDTLHQRKAAIPRDLQMELLRNLGEAEYLRGRKIVAQEYFDKVLKQSRDLLEKLKVFDFKIALLASAGQHSEAVGVGLQALKSAGFKIRSYSKSQEKKLLQSWTKPALKFVDLQRKRRKKKAPAPEKSSLARILAQTITPAFLLDSGYLPSLLDTLLELSRKDGPFPETSVGMVLLGALLGPGADGRKIGDQALDLAERYNAVELRGRVHYYYLSAIHPWNQPWESGIPRYRRAADYCLEAGDLPFAALSLLEFLSRQVLLCRNLPDLEIVPRYEQEIVRTGQEDSIELYWLLRQVAQNFQAGGKNKTRLQGDFFDEDKHAKNWKGRKSFYLSLYKHWLAYVFFPDVSALPPLVGSENWPRAHIDTILYEYLRIALPFMTGAGRYSESACDELLSRLAELEKDAPPDFAFMRHHLQAEKRWKLGQVQEAMTAFDLACEAPQQPLFAGIIHERTAQFYLWMEKPRFARIYAEKARSIYSTMQSHTQIQQAERLL